MRRLTFIFFLLMLLSFNEGISEQDGRMIDKKDVIISHQSDSLLNMQEWTSDSLRQISLESDTQTEFFLKASADAPIYVFYGDRLVTKSKNGLLNHKLENLSNEVVFLSLAKDVRNLNYNLYSIKKSIVNDAYQSLEISSRSTKWLSDNILLILLIGASILMVLVKINYDKRYLNIMSLRKVFTFRLKEGDQSRIRVMDQDNLVFAGLYVFLTAGLIYFLLLGKGIQFLGVEADGILAFFKIFLFILVGIIGKVLLVALASNLFGNSRISAFYIKEMLNINLFFLVILFFTSILLYLYFGTIPPFWLSVAIYGLLILYLARLILLYFKILKLSSFSNLYLFSYFCTTEIFPFLIGLKYFI